MKNLILCLLLSGLVAVACQKEFDLKNPDVDEFVGLIKNGKYQTPARYVLPDFSVNHIDRLLYYLDDTTHLEMFPANPISSKRTQLKILNECILWTIDGVRFENKYPSLEPLLLKDIGSRARLTVSEFRVVASIYRAWFEEYKKNPSQTLKKKNLFVNTPYQWD